MTSTSTGESFDDYFQGTSDDGSISSTHSSDNSNRFKSTDVDEEKEDLFFSSVEDESTSTPSSFETDPLSDEESNQITSSSVLKSKSSEGIRRKKCLITTGILLLLCVMAMTVLIVIFVGGMNGSLLPKKSFQFLECSLKDTRLCDSGEYTLLNSDLNHGFLSVNEKEESFSIIFSSRDEYIYHFSQLQQYFEETKPMMASYGSYGGDYGGGGGGGDYNNMEYLGTGYDVFTANPLFSAGVDNGFRMNIFESQSFLVDAKSSLSCDLDFDVYVMDSDSKLRDTRHNVVKINHKQTTNSRQQYDYDDYEGAEAPTQRESFKLPTFSLSHDNLKTVMKITSKNRVFAITSSECEIYRMNLIKFNHPPPTETFSSAVETLLDYPWDELNNEEQEVYVDFIEAFGTHVVTKAHMGAKFSYEYEMNKYYFQKEDTHNVQNSLKLLGIDATMIDNQKAEDTLDDLIVNMRLLSVGARPVYSIDRSNSPDEKERDKAELWASNSEINPLPIHYEVTPINEYYYYQFGTKVKLLDGVFKVSNMEKAISMYYHRSKTYMDQHPRYLEKCEMKDGKAVQFGDFHCIGSPPKEKLEWWAARQKCQLWGGDLVVLDDRMKNYFVSENFASQGTWIGYYYMNKMVPNKKMLSSGVDGEKDKKKNSDDEDERFINTRMMKWVNGEPKGYENFYFDQPDGGEKKKDKKKKKKNKSVYESTDEYCIQTNHEQTSSWADSNCRNRLEYVCERPLYPPQSEYYTSSDDEYDDGEPQDGHVSRSKDCSDGEAFQGYCYRHFREGMDWGSAKFECTRWVPVSWGGRLAVVGSEGVSDFLKSTVLSASKENDISDFSAKYQKYYEEMMKESGESDLRSVKMRKYIWIGLSDIAQEGVWKWEDGKYMGNYRNFDVSLSDKKRDNNDCAAMNKENGLWVNRDCFRMSHEFVCQYKM